MFDTPGHTTAARSACGVAREIRTPAADGLDTGGPLRRGTFGVVASLTGRRPFRIVTARWRKATVQYSDLLRLDAQRAFKASQAAQAGRPFGIRRTGAHAARVALPPRPNRTDPCHARQDNQPLHQKRHQVQLATRLAT